MGEVAVYCYVVVKDNLGQESTIRYASSGTDARTVAAAAFASYAKKGIQVVWVETFDRPPEHWEPIYSVRHLQTPAVPPC